MGTERGATGKHNEDESCACPVWSNLHSFAQSFFQTWNAILLTSVLPSPIHLITQPRWLSLSSKQSFIHPSILYSTTLLSSQHLPGALIDRNTTVSDLNELSLEGSYLLNKLSSDYLYSWTRDSLILID